MYLSIKNLVDKGKHMCKTCAEAIRKQLFRIKKKVKQCKFVVKNCGEALDQLSDKFDEESPCIQLKKQDNKQKSPDREQKN